MFTDFAQRTQQAEIMDDLTIQGPELEGALRSLERVNRLLGGHRLILKGLDQIRHRVGLPGSGQRAMRILDLGCGAGDTLLAIARWGKRHGLSLQLTGWDANPHTVDYARSRCAGVSRVEIRQADAFTDPLPEGTDVVLCSLFLHHFSDEAICGLIRRIESAGVPVILINDLHRSPLAYGAFQLFCSAFRIPYMARHDGLVSIRRGFSRQDWDEIIQTAAAYSPSLSWQWAFRWQLLLHKPFA